MALNKECQGLRENFVKIRFEMFFYERIYLKLELHLDKFRSSYIELISRENCYNIYMKFYMT